MNLFELERVTPEEVLAHPRHRAAQAALVKLIEQLRACSDVEEGYAFQEDLLEQVLAVERDRNSLSQALKRIASRKHPQAGAPEPQSGRDPAERETWQFEHDVCERVARQFRCVGDALAWRVFGYDRRHIIALCRNQSPGVMAGKKGLERERETVREAFVEDGRFADARPDQLPADRGRHRLHGRGPGDRRGQDERGEAGAQHSQTRRIKAARLALGGKAPLPGDDPASRLHALDIPLKTHLDVLRRWADPTQIDTHPNICRNVRDNHLLSGT
jgi:hypothetical protein